MLEARHYLALAQQGLAGVALTADALIVMAPETSAFHAADLGGWYPTPRNFDLCDRIPFHEFRIQSAE